MRLHSRIRAGESVRLRKWILLSQAECELKILTRGGSPAFKKPSSFAENHLLSLIGAFHEIHAFDLGIRSHSFFVR